MKKEVCLVVEMCQWTEIQVGYLTFYHFKNILLYCIHVHKVQLLFKCSSHQDDLCFCL